MVVTTIRAEYAHELANAQHVAVGRRPASYPGRPPTMRGLPPVLPAAPTIAPDTASMTAGPLECRVLSRKKLLRNSLVTSQA